MKSLSDSQKELISKVEEAFISPYGSKVLNIQAAFISDSIYECFGDSLKIHHVFSYEPFTKDKFEYALVRAFNRNGILAEMALSRASRGHDVTINGVKFSLKTQADATIREDRIHISKYMELGKGTWTDKVENLHELRQNFLEHLTHYDRILTLRCLSKANPHRYELIEIPKSLLLESQNGQFTVMSNSKQIPKPGYCVVTDKGGIEEKYKLYFDGGSERKLQIKDIKIKFCIKHAEWNF
jgi:hypothetical protein